MLCITRGEGGRGFVTVTQDPDKNYEKVTLKADTIVGCQNAVALHFGCAATVGNESKRIETALRAIAKDLPLAEWHVMGPLRIVSPEVNAFFASVRRLVRDALGLEVEILT